MNNKTPIWTQFRSEMLGPRTNHTVKASPEITLITIDDGGGEWEPGQEEDSHPDRPLVVKELSKRSIQGELISVTNHKPVCDLWHEVYAIELGFYHYDRRWVFALVRFGG